MPIAGAIPEGDADEELSKHPQFQHLVDTLQKHQQMLYECSQQQQEVVNALMGVPEIADALKTFPFFLGTDSAECCNGQPHDTAAIAADANQPYVNEYNSAWRYIQGDENMLATPGMLDDAVPPQLEAPHLHGTDDHHDFFHKTFSDELRDLHQYVEDIGGALWSRPIRRLLQSRSFELWCTGIMLGNVLCMVLRLEIEGLLVGEQLGVLRNTGMHSGALDVMENIEVFFTLWFTVELLLRVWVYGYTLLTDPMNVFDALVVIATLVDVIFTRLLALNDGGVNLSVARVIRLVKVLKLLRTFKAASVFTEVRVLLRTVLRSTMALVWALIVLSLIILTASNLMAQLLGDFIADTSNTIETRKWVYERYGTASRAAWTVMQATLSGGWPNYANTLVMEVSPLWAVWWFFYVFFVIFAVIRVMSALFLTASMKAANDDQDMQAIIKTKDFQKCGKQLGEIFRSPATLARIDAETENITPARQQEIDQERKSYILHSDVLSILSQPKCIDLLNRFGFETVEIKMLFNILAHGSNKVRWDIFLRACMRLKGGVKAIDVVEILYALEGLKRQTHPTQAQPVSARNEKRARPTCSQPVREQQVSTRVRL